MRTTLIIFVILFTIGNLISQIESYELLMPINVTAKIVFIEPLPYTTPVLGDLMLNHTQRAWIKTINNDSMAVIFNDKVLDGYDIFYKYSKDILYEFELQPCSTDNKQTIKIEIASDTTVDHKNNISEVSAEYINSLPIITLVDSSDMVISHQYYIVKSINILKEK